MRKFLFLLAMIVLTAGVVSAQNNRAAIIQQGDGNLGFVESTGSSNEAYINQLRGGHDDHGEEGGDDHEEGGCDGGCGGGCDGDDHHVATLSADHGHGSGVYSNQAYITQVGDENFAQIDQMSNSNVVRYTVAGNGNKFWALQKGKGGHIMDFDLSQAQADGNNGNFIHASQRGRDNGMWVTIKGSNTPDFQFHQRGNGNTVQGINGGRFYFEGDQARQFDVSQRGKGNTLEGEISHATDIDLKVDQRGQYNYTSLDSEDFSNTIDVTQRCGANNYTSIYQRNGGSTALGAGHSALVFQKGDNNTANIQQTL